MTAAQDFLRNAATKSADLVHRQIIRRGIDHYETAVAAGRSRFQNWEAARQKCQEIKREAVDHLDRYLEEFERRVKDRGGQVFWGGKRQGGMRVHLADCPKPCCSNHREIKIDGRRRNSPDLRS
jgi:L-lactate dehydrogenase complex protein LldF